MAELQDPLDVDQHSIDSISKPLQNGLHTEPLSMRVVEPGASVPELYRLVRAVGLESRMHFGVPG